MTLVKNKCEAFLNGLALPSLSEADSDHLARPITMLELREAVADMQRGKAPGWDGIPPELYLSFWDILGPLLLSMIQYSIEQGKFSRDVNTALISLRLKKDKNPTDCSGYRPFSLLCSDLKIYAEVLAPK